MLLSLIFGLIVGALAVIFALQNIFPVTVTFLLWELTTSLAVLISLALLMGIIVSSFFAIPGAIKNMFVISNLKKENKKLSDELETIHRTAQDALATSTIVTPPLTIL